MPSIRQGAYPDLLPDFRNLAVMARVLVAVNALALFGVLFAAPNVAQGLERFVQAAAFLEPLLFAELLALFVLSALLARLPYWGGCVAVVALVVATAGAYHGLVREIASVAVPALPRTLVLSALGA